MVKTQIQLPDAMYKDLKNLALAKEWSLAETLRRAAELFLTTQPSSAITRQEWTLPKARRCGNFLAPENQWTELAHEA